MSAKSVSLPTFDGLTFRPIRPEDLDSWFDLEIRVANAENAPWLEQKTALLNIISSSANPVADNTVIGLDEQGVPRAVGNVSHNAASPWGFAFGAVDPAWQRRGIGRAIISWQEQRLTQRFADEDPEISVPVMRSFLQDGNAAHQGLLEAAGLGVVRYFSEMLRPLDSLPTLPLADGFEIVPFSEQLSEQVRLAHNDAFRDHWGSDPRSVEQWGNLVEDEHLKFEWCSVVVDRTSGEIAGYQMSSFDPDKFDREGRMEGYTDLLGVPRAWRGRGIAPALLADAMARFKASGMDFATLDVDTENPSGALGLYESLGYAPIRCSTAWDKKLACSEPGYLPAAGVGTDSGTGRTSAP